MAQQHPPQIGIPATYMRGGTSKGVFFNRADLPEAARSVSAPPQAQPAITTSRSPRRR